MNFIHHKIPIKDLNYSSEMNSKMTVNVRRFNVSFSRHVQILFKHF